MSSKTFVAEKTAHDLSVEMLCKQAGSTQKRRTIFFALNFGAMRTTVSYLEQTEQLRLQQLCHWYYFYGVPRVQSSLHMLLDGLLFGGWKDSLVRNQIIGVFRNGVTKTFTPNQTTSILSEAETTPDLPIKKGSNIQMTCQLDRNTLFHLKSKTNLCHLLLIRDARAGTYSMVPKRPAPIKREWPCLAYDKEQSCVYVIGGIKEKSVSRYSLLDDQWSDDVPALANNRGIAAACILNATIYVVGGLNITPPKVWKDIESIEKLDTRDPTATQWTEISLTLKINHSCVFAL